MMSSQAQLLNLALDLRVLGFTLGVSLLTAMFFGLVPAIGASRVDPQALLRSGHQPDGSRLRADSAGCSSRDKSPPRCSSSSARACSCGR